MESTCSSNHTALYKVVASHTNSLIKPISTHLTSKPSAIGDTIGTGFENYLDRCLELHLRSGPMVFGFQNELLVATRCGDCEMCEPNCELYVCMHVLVVNCNANCSDPLPAFLPCYSRRLATQPRFEVS